MSSPDVEHFYSNLPLKHHSVSDFLSDESAFSTIPDQWHVVIIDVKNSTKAVENNLHDLVNLTATGSIIAVLNIAREANIEIPFFFGGDGGTLIIPQSLLDSSMTALREHAENTKKSFDLDLWLGSVPVSKIKQDNHQLKVGRVALGDKFVIPVVLGTGLKYAESLVKHKESSSPVYQAGDSRLDLQGMECRWDKIKPPPNTSEVVCLLVEAKQEERQAYVFKKVMDELTSIYGPLPDRRPISLPKLKLDNSLAKIRKEMMVKLSVFNPFYLVRNWFLTLMGKYYFQFNKKGRKYLEDLIEFSDTLVIDGRINTVISGTAKQREQLIAALDKMEQSGDIIFGHHLSSNSIMSCYVRDRQDQHIHFVDGADGGYTRAATQLKGKIKKAIKNTS